MMRKPNERGGMLRDSVARLLFGCAVAVLGIACLAGHVAVAQQLELIAPTQNKTLQAVSDAFVVFFSPERGDSGLEGLRISLTNTTGNTLSIDWTASRFTLPGGEESAVITDDIPDSLQLIPTQIAIRQTVELVVIPLSNVSHSEAGWSTRPIDTSADGELTLHLALQEAQQEAPTLHDFTFRVVEPLAQTAEPRVASTSLLWAVLALGVGLALGALLF